MMCGGSGVCTHVGHYRRFTVPCFRRTGRTCRPTWPKILLDRTCDFANPWL
jgi:hypothetical protein